MGATEGGILDMTERVSTAKRKRKAFRAEVDEIKRIKESPGVVGWQGGCASHLLSGREYDFDRRTPKAKRLDELDGDNNG